MLSSNRREDAKMNDEVEQGLTAADFERCQWEQVVDSAARGTCFDYFELFGKKCTDAAATNDRSAPQSSVFCAR